MKISQAFVGILVLVALLSRNSLRRHDTAKPAVVEIETSEPGVRTDLRFQVGDCVQFDHEYEKWEEPPLVERIMEIGRYAYRTCAVGDHCTAVLDNRHPGFTLSFRNAEGYKRVSCGGL